MSIIIGTAGHIDHGKTALIKALNGFEGDQTELEKARGITMQLSFSNLTNGEKNIAFIDVPGHESLVKTMISGAFGFDAAMLVVAANEGLKPQSLEHIRILALLDVKRIVLVITKTDKASHEEAKQVEKDATKELQALGLEPIKSFFTSTKNQDSFLELKEFLFSIKPRLRSENAPFRYYIDRSFSLKGFGQIVTGTVLGAGVSVGDKVMICNLNQEAQVRSIQIHDMPCQYASAGQRVALNLSGANGVQKGMLIAKKGLLRGFSEADCVVFAKDISHGADVLFCVGSSQIPAKVVILSSQDQSHFVSFKFSQPLFLCFDEPFILLQNSRVIGGGRVLNPIVDPLKKQLKIQLLNLLMKKDFKGAFGLLKSFHKNGFGLISSFQRFGLSHEKALEIAHSLNDVFVDERALNIYNSDAKKRVGEFISFVLSKNSYAIFSASSIALKLPWASQALAQAAIDEALKNGKLAHQNGVYFKAGADFSQIKVRLEDEIYRLISSQDLTPEAPYNIYDNLEIDRQSGDNALKKLCASGRVLRLAHNLFVCKSALEKAINAIKELIKADGSADVQSVKENLGLSRKYAIAYLEWLDKEPNIIKQDQQRRFRR